jgi:hypothetical protein
MRSLQTSLAYAMGSGSVEQLFRARSMSPFMQDCSIRLPRLNWSGVTLRRDMPIGLLTVGTILRLILCIWVDVR